MLSLQTFQIMPKQSVRSLGNILKKILKIKLSTITTKDLESTNNHLTKILQEAIKITSHMIE